MANKDHVNILRRGIKVWNQWRLGNPDIVRPDLSGMDLSGLYLGGANLRYTDLSNTILDGTKFTPQFRQAVPVFLNAGESNNADIPSAIGRIECLNTDLQGANLNSSSLVKANLSGVALCWSHFVKADLSGANLINADLRFANLYRATLCHAQLQSAKLECACLVEANLTKADLTGARVYGLNAWKANLAGAAQGRLIVTPEDESPTSVDNLEVAQLIYTFLNNNSITRVFEGLTTRVSLILGRFTEERKAILNAVWDELRSRGFVPILFDFDKPRGATTLGTVVTLAGLARFVIADITDPRSVPQELQAIVNNHPLLPIQPLLQEGNLPWGMFDNIKVLPQVREVCYYADWQDLSAKLRQLLADQSLTGPRVS